MWELWTPEQVEAFHQAMNTAYEQIWLPMRVPASSAWKEALRHALVDSQQAWGSVFHFWFLTLRPLVILIGIVAHRVGLWFWKTVIVQGMSQQGVQIVKKFAIRFYEYERTLTKRELAVQAVALVSVVAIYRIRQFWMRQAYFKRLAKWYAGQKKRLSIAYDRYSRNLYKTYGRIVERIAERSLQAAIMTPHIALTGIAVTTKLLLPKWVTWLACDTALITFLRGIYPSFCTVMLLHEKRLPEPEGSAKEKKESSKRGRRRSLFFPKTTPTKASEKVLRQKEIRECEEHWIQFWIVSAAAQACKQLLTILPIVSSFYTRSLWMQSGLRQLELLFYIWIYTLPYLLPPLKNAPEGRPLALLAPRIGKAASNIYRGLNIVTPGWWEATVVRTTSLGLDAFVLLRVLSREFADQLLHVISNGQSFVIPVGTLLMPRFISIYGVLFVKYVAFLHKQRQRPALPRDTILSFWILHSCVTMLLDRFAGVLWWIPLSQAFIFAIYTVLAVSPRIVDQLFELLLHELEVFCILARTRQDRGTTDNSLAVQGFQTLLKHLPSAAETPTKAGEVSEEEIKAKETTPDSEPEPIRLFEGVDGESEDSDCVIVKKENTSKKPTSSGSRRSGRGIVEKEKASKKPTASGSRRSSRSRNKPVRLGR